MNKMTFVVGFMLFAIFFGAGNLIFPPKLGLDSGVDFLPSILGFVSTGVGLPLLGIIVSAFYQGGYKNALAQRVHPTFSLIFLMAIYLTIGPFFAIPRTGATAYQMAAVPFIGDNHTGALFIFTLIYYALTLWFSLNPSKMVDRIGSLLTPVLLLAIIALVVKAVGLLEGMEVGASKLDPDTPFFTGMIEGYATMDALAALAFSVIVINAIKARGVDGSGLFKQTVLAGIVAAAGLGIVYVSLAWIGNRYPISPETLNTLIAQKQHIGTFILNSIATDTYGTFGRTLLGIIVTLACLTTSIGLVVAVSQYFHEVFPKISYKAYAVLFTLISFTLANQGLDAVIAKSVPVLMVLYPIAMSVMLLLLLAIFLPLGLWAMRIALLLVSLIAIASVSDLAWTNALPLNAFSMEWLPFAIVGLGLGWGLDRILRK